MPRVAGEARPHPPLSPPPPPNPPPPPPTPPTPRQANPRPKENMPASPFTPVVEGTPEQGLYTLVHFSAQLERFVWDRGCAQGLCSPC